MDTNLARAFIVLADKLSFTHAADELNTTQPLLSRAIRRLEDIVGEQLIDRSKRQIALTPAGQAFREQAQGIIDRVDFALQRTRRAGHGALGMLRIGFMPAVTSQPIHYGIAAFREKYPDVVVELVTMTEDDLGNALRAGELDAGLFLFNHTDRRDLTWRTIARSGIILALPSLWNTPPDVEVAMESLQHATFILAHPDWAPQVYSAHIACCDAAGFRPKNVRYVRDSLEMRVLVASGFGVGFAYETALETPFDGIDFRPIANCPANLVVEFHIGWVPERPPKLVRDLINCLSARASEARTILSDGRFRLVWTSFGMRDPLYPGGM